LFVEGAGAGLETEGDATAFGSEGAGLVGRDGIEDWAWATRAGDVPAAFLGAVALSSTQVALMH
jgi:hypothetical protein